MTEDLMRLVDDLRAESLSYTAIAALVERRHHETGLISYLKYYTGGAAQRQQPRGGQQPLSFASKEPVVRLVSQPCSLSQHF